MGVGNGIESCSIRQTQIVRTGEAHHPADVDGRSGAKEKAVGVHQEEIGGWEPPWSVGLNHAKDTGRIASVDPAQDVGGRQVWKEQRTVLINRSRIEEVCDVIGRDVEVAEAVIQIQSASRSGATRDVVLGVSSWKGEWRANLRVEPR